MAEERNGGFVIPKWALWLVAFLLLPAVGWGVRQEIRGAEAYTKDEQALHVAYVTELLRAMTVVMESKANREDIPGDATRQALDDIRRRLDRLEARP